MSKLAFVANFPEVKSAVLGSRDGTVYEVVNEPDAEGLAAIMGFATTLLVETGETLGLGDLERFFITSPDAAHLVSMVGDDALTVSLDPKKSPGAIAKRLNSALK